MKMTFGLFAVTLGASGSIALAQTTAQAHWQISTDNGSTWRTGHVTVPQTQASVLVQAVVTVYDQGVPFLSQTRARFAQAAIEGYIQSDTVRSDQVSTVRLLRTGLPASLQTTAFSVSQHGLVLKLDAFNDFSPPGQSAALSARNTVTPIGSIPSTVNPIPILQYRLSLDGSAGDRVFTGGFLAFTGFITDPTLSVAAGQIAVYPPSGPEAAFAADMVQSSATLTVVPSPGCACMLAALGALAARRRRA